MSSQLEKRVLKLELAKNPSMRIEDLLKQIDDGNQEHLPYISGESKLADLLNSLRDEVVGAQSI